MRDNSVEKGAAVGKVLLPSLLINLLSLAVPLTVLQIYDRILPNQSYGTATLLLAGALLAVVMESFIRFVRSWILSAAASNTEKATYQDIIGKITTASPSQIRHVGIGGIEEGLGAVSKVKDWYSGGIISGFIDLPFALIFLALVGYIGGELVVIPIVVWCLTLCVVWLSSQKVKVLSEHASQNEKQRKAFLILLGQTIQGIKRQAVESRIFSQFKSINHARSQSKAKEEEQNAFAQECIQLAALATSVLLVISGSLWVLDGDLTTGGLAACSILAGRAVAPLSALVGVRIKMNGIHSATQAIEKLDALSVSDAAKQEGMSFTNLELREVTVERYGLSHQLALKAEVGQIILIESDVRHLASFMLSSLAGVDQPSGGDVLADGESIGVSTLSAMSGFCGAKAQLVSGTILDNLCGFNPAQTDKATHYARRLGLTKEITRLPDGLETKIGHTSASPLSMGNVKLLNIAAQLASSKPILLLDRPDASLDLDGLERLVAVLKQEVVDGRTIFLVTYHPMLRTLAHQSAKVNDVVAINGKGEAA
ncbi:ABC transporter transmembrane domain-containing protein [Vibrio genomosp. F10]|uniref:ABC transporter n=1 Tax=Vibrio genomosp. F10 str. ZF-129 TaxID=1187848 RepID=A0A1E5BAF5_9VIBR|nr:ABC transporter ATP-binding protein [Vibrio genomosp. F10]OEE30911.1 ABC transporter [Vibrio genomosp. F10 str. ZF-129]OEE94542.1 ABC transporter [Vibrio genomosp. F10 str. 9ZC157]OEF03853.1 ABC transporter [Vibrio genomosp. F10 str. 9ZB36]